MNIFISILLMVIFPVYCSQAESLGRLFFTPEQRVKLENQQATNASSVINTTHSLLILNGIVQKHSGGRTVWINGAAQSLSKGGDPNEESIYLPGKLQSRKLKVGQEMMLEYDVPQSSPSSSE